MQFTRRSCSLHGTGDSGAVEMDTLPRCAHMLPHPGLIGALAGHFPRAAKTQWVYRVACLSHHLACRVPRPHAPPTRW